MNLRKIVILALVFLFLSLPVFMLAFLVFSAVHAVFLGIFICIAACFSFYFSQLMEEREQLIWEIEDREKKSAQRSAAIASSPISQDIYSPEYLNTRFSEEFDRSKRYQRPMSVFYTQFDGVEEILKKFPDLSSGAVSQEGASYLKKNLRSVDIVIKKNDSQIMIILPETGFNGGRIAGERLRFAVEKNIFGIGGHEIKMTATMAMVSFDNTIHLAKQDMLTSLDKTLIEAQKAGPNILRTLTEEV